MLDLIPVSPFAIVLTAKEMHINVVLAAVEMPGNSDLHCALSPRQLEITKSEFYEITQSIFVQMASRKKDLCVCLTPACNRWLKTRHFFSARLVLTF